MHGLQRLLGPSALSLAIVGGTVVAIRATSAAPPAVPATAPSEARLHDHLVELYLDAKWDDLEPLLAAKVKEINALPAPQKADVLYIRQAVAECRPAWWKQCKTGKKTSFRATVWNRTFAAVYDPNNKLGVHVQSVNGQVTITLGWAAEDMDNPAEAEHGFTKADLSQLGAWTVLGNAEGWSLVPAGSLVGLDEKGKAHFTRFLEFRGNVAGAYYGTPRARRWGFFLGLLGYSGKHAGDAAGPSRRAMGAMLLAEVVGNRAKYPSISMPTPAPADDVEAKLAEHVRDWIEHHSLTLAEDQALREAIKAFAAANGREVQKTNTIVLPNKLHTSLDPDLDKPERAKRDAWLKAHLSQ